MAPFAKVVGGDRLKERGRASQRLIQGSRRYIESW